MGFVTICWTAEPSSPADRSRWDALWAEELATQGPLLAAEKEINSAQPSEGYFKFNLDHLTGFNLLRTTTGTDRAVIARGFAVMDKTTRNDGNAHFEALTYGLTGESARRDAAVQHLFQWLDYRQNTAAGARISNSARCGRDLACTRKDRADMTFDAVARPIPARAPVTMTTRSLILLLLNGLPRKGRPGR